MNARDGMRRLRAERKLYHLCYKCGMPLPQDYRFTNCPDCMKRQHEYNKEYQNRKRGENCAKCDV